MTKIDETLVKELLADPTLMKELQKIIKENKISTPRVPKSGIWREEKLDKWNNFTGYKMVYVVAGVRKTVSFNQGNMSRKELAGVVDTEILRLSRKYHLSVST